MVTATKTVNELPPRPSERPETPSELTEKPSFVIVELDELQPLIAIRRLRKGKGKLYRHIGRIVHDLTEDGTVKAGAQPLVVVVQQMPSSPWALFDDD